ncbi:hypothetical protein [Streptomyces luteireticuli]|uniref:hypothetical protein n=1 Tax=Streptomyces luteireticuli TaxID=173858 RepID=UPI0035578C09
MGTPAPIRVPRGTGLLELNVAFAGLLLAGCGAWRLPGSRRPEPPDVSHLVPVVRRETAVDRARHRVTRTRRQSGFRVHLRRPRPPCGDGSGDGSGDGALLAVVLGPGLPDDLATRCAADPVRTDGTPPPPLTPANFPDAVRTASVLLAEPVDGAPASAAIAAFAPFSAPSFDPGLRLWACDIGLLLPDPARFPYVRLALARHRPYSLDPLHLSEVTTTGFLRLLPDRTITATMTAAGAIRLELGGPVPSDVPGAGRTAVAASRRVLATVERRAAGGGDLDWTGTGTVLELTCVPTARSFTWSGDLVPPVPQLLPPSEYRLLVEEYELRVPDPAAAPAGRRPVHADRFGLTVSRPGRLVLRE